MSATEKKLGQAKFSMRGQRHCACCDSPCMKNNVCATGGRFHGRIACQPNRDLRRLFENSVLVAAKNALRRVDDKVIERIVNRVRLQKS
jgi:hypothetical protein